MDWHSPLIWINAFSHLGLIALAQMAEAAGHSADSARYRQEADALQQALRIYAQQAFGEDERDFVCALWPTHAFSSVDEWLTRCYESWWRDSRLQGHDTYTPEPLWKYFELGQAHNYLYLGEREKTQQTVEYYLTHHDIHGLYGWLEDNHDIAEFWNAIEGWYNQSSRQPHGWVSSEFWLLLRDMLLYEENDELVVGAGIPSLWMQQETPFAIRGAPSTFGPLDFRVTRQDKHSYKVIIRFHQLDRLPRRLQLRLSWSASLLTIDNKNGVIFVPLERYEQTGYAEIIVMQK